MGASARVFRGLAGLGLLEPVTPELQQDAVSERLWRSLSALDRFRARFDRVPESLTNPVLLGCLLVPLGFSLDGGHPSREGGRRWLGDLPVARRDVERLYQVLALQRRLRDRNISPRAARAVIARGAFADALTWLDVHGQAPDDVARWRELVSDLEASGALTEVRREPYRRRRRRPRRSPPQ